MKINALDEHRILTPVAVLENGQAGDAVRIEFECDQILKIC